MEQKLKHLVGVSSYSGHSDPYIYTFIRENANWYIDLPGYLEKGGSKEDLQMEVGADDLLTLMAWGKKHITITMDTESFEDAVVLNLIQLCKAPKGGGYYFIRDYSGIEVNKLMWLRDINLFVFGDMPERIFIKRIKQNMQ